MGLNVQLGGVSIKRIVETRRRTTGERVGEG